MPKGRPAKSEIRQNIIEILHYLQQGYGYQIARMYNEIFPTVTQRSVYYHLRKGVQLKQIRVHKVESEQGEYSWGPMVEKVYYTLGKEADPKGQERVKRFIAQWKK